MPSQFAQAVTRAAYGVRQLPRVAWYIGHSLALRERADTVRQSEKSKARRRVHTDAPVPDRKRIYADMAKLSRSLNVELQVALNPAGDRKVERFGWTFAPGDKVMQIENDYDKEVYNGDIGFVVGVEPEEEGELTASFDGRSVTYGFGELDTLVPAYAASIHKSQGSEYPAVVIPVMTQHYAMLQRNLLYTGVTRGKRLVVLVGQKKAIAIAVRNVSGRRRWSKLNEWLCSGVLTQSG